MTNETRGSTPVRHSSFELRHSFIVSSRLELRRAFSFSYGTRDRNIGKLGAIDGATEQQSSPAHIAATDEIGGETEPLPEMFEEHVDVFGGRDAAEENDLAFRRQRFREPFHAALERRAIARLVFVNVQGSEFLEIGKTNRRCGRDQSACGGDDENRRALLTRRREGIRIGEFAAKIETAEEREHFAERGWLFASEPASQVELSALTHDHFCTQAARIGRRKKEKAFHQAQEATVISLPIKSDETTALALNRFPEDASFP